MFQKDESKIEEAHFLWTKQKNEMNRMMKQFNAD